MINSVFTASRSGLATESTASSCRAVGHRSHLTSTTRIGSNWEAAIPHSCPGGSSLRPGRLGSVHVMGAICSRRVIFSCSRPSSTTTSHSKRRSTARGGGYRSDGNLTVETRLNDYLTTKLAYFGIRFPLGHSTVRQRSDRSQRGQRPFGRDRIAKGRNHCQVLNRVCGKKNGRFTGMAALRYS